MGETTQEEGPAQRWVLSSIPGPGGCHSYDRCANSAEYAVTVQATSPQGAERLYTVTLCRTHAADARSWPCIVSVQDAVAHLRPERS